MNVLMIASAYSGATFVWKISILDLPAASCATGPEKTFLKLGNPESSLESTNLTVHKLNATFHRSHPQQQASLKTRSKLQLQAPRMSRLEVNLFTRMSVFVWSHWTTCNSLPDPTWLMKCQKVEVLYFCVFKTLPLLSRVLDFFSLHY